MTTGHSFQNVSIFGSSHLHMGDTYGVEAEHSPMQECLRSLAFLEMNDRPNNIAQAAEGTSEGTCKWLLGHQTYRDWVSHHRGLLWIKGKPGSGKSTLLRYALRNVQAEHGAEDRTLILSFFFHGRGSELQRTPLGLFRSLLHQLLSQIPSALSDIVETFKYRQKTIGTPGEKWRWHPHELQGFLESSLLKVLDRCPVKIFVDGLDECGVENVIGLVDIFKALLQRLPSTTSQFGICFTCRHYPILEFDDGLAICVEQENEGDIATYVQARLSVLRIRSTSVILHEITARAEGVFLWARLVVERVLELERKGVGLRRIRPEIQRMPPDLGSLYQELLGSIDEVPASLKLMQWICFATRPLSLDELRWAMAVDADCPHKTLQQCQKAEDYIDDNEKMERRVKTLSCGLAEIVPSFNAQVVQVIHQSVKDFFVERGPLALDAAPNSENSAAGGAHYRLSRSCIRYLAMGEIAQSIGLNWWNLASMFPLLHYATTSWVTHAKQSEAEMVSQVERLFCGRHKDIAKRLLATEKVDINAKDKYGRTPLLWAVENRHEAIVELLLATEKVDVDSKDADVRTPLWWAAGDGHEA
ncbi:hypothetical protein K469DRAFT_633216, partial [Zopfia rhizophila CBS 207.26]